MTETICSTTIPKEVLDLENAYDTIPVTIAGYVTDVNVEISLSHNNVGDVELYLISPEGVEVDLSVGNGGSGANYINTVFDDDADTPITSASAPFSGSYKSEEPLSLLNGTYMPGDWVLRIYDNEVGYEGNLVEYCLHFTYYMMPVGIEEDESTVAELHQNYPNPFKDYTFIKFELNKPGVVSLHVFDFLGREVMTIDESQYGSGAHLIKLDGSGLPAGRYFYRLQTDNEVIVKSMIHLR
jgi:subtilisin-like proprotein convertase family protein